MLLDIVEVARSHSGINLAAAFAQILEDFGISDKVSQKKKRNQLNSLKKKILSITCDNASNNDTMITELASLLDDFPGPANQTRCFAHVLNLVVKSIIRQFDLPDSKNGKIFNDGAKELLNLAGDIEVEEDVASRDGEDGVAGEDDNIEGWIDERTLMDDEDLKELEESVEPVCVLLTKVSRFFNT
jgi:hypothetical protein